MALSIITFAALLWEVQACGGQKGSRACWYGCAVRNCYGKDGYCMCKRGYFWAGAAECRKCPSGEDAIEAGCGTQKCKANARCKRACNAGKLAMFIGIPLPGVLLIMLWCYCKKKKNKKSQVATESGDTGLHIGMDIKVMSKTQQIRQGKVCGMKDGQVLIHYVGYEEKYDEWIPAASQRLLPNTAAAATPVVAQPPQAWEQSPVTQQIPQQIQIVSNAPPPPAPEGRSSGGSAMDSIYVQGLREAKGLFDEGVFSAEEFEREKMKLTAERDARQAAVQDTAAGVQLPQKLPMPASLQPQMPAASQSLPPMPAENTGNLSAKNLEGCWAGVGCSFYMCPHAECINISAKGPDEYKTCALVDCYMPAVHHWKRVEGNKFAHHNDCCGSAGGRSGCMTSTVHHKNKITYQGVDNGIMWR